MAKVREPIDLIIAKGKKNLTKEEIQSRRDAEIKAPCENVEAPSYLPDELKDEFNKLSKILIDIGIMSDLDVTALGRFLVSEHLYQKITLKMLSMKYVTDNYFDYAKLQDRHFKQARAAASDIGLTISSRCKLVIPKKEKIETTNKFVKFAK